MVAIGGHLVSPELDKETLCDRQTELGPAQLRCDRRGLVVSRMKKEQTKETGEEGRCVTGAESRIKSIVRKRLGLSSFLLA